MADICIDQDHQLSEEQARAAAQAMADQLVKEYGMSSDWDGDVLQFSGSGLTGSLTLAAGSARVEISLGMMLRAFAPMIGDKVSGKMKKVFAGTA